MLQINITDIQGVRVVKAIHASDLRGQFIKYHPNAFLRSRLESVAVSINPTIGTIRGIHFQVEPYAEEKIVTCLQGEVFEVIVDIRPDSKTYGKIATFQLSDKDLTQIFLPKGIAHGFQTLQSNTIVHYSLTSEYSAEHSYSINPFSDLGIKWPRKECLISEKDSNGITLLAAQLKYSESISS